MALVNNRFSLFLPTKEPIGENWRALERWGNSGGLPSFSGGVISALTTASISDNGNIKYLMQAESVTHTPDASGDSTITFPTPFPNGVISILVTNGDALPVSATFHTRAATVDSFILNIYDNGGGGVPVPYTTITRTNYLAIGW